MNKSFINLRKMVKSLLSIIRIKKNNIIGFYVNRPGDFYVHAAALCYLLKNKNLVRKKIIIKTDEDSQFFILKKLFPELANNIYFTKSKIKLISAVKYNIGLFKKKMIYDYKDLLLRINSYQSSFKDQIIKNENEFWLFITIETEKRRWVNQVEALKEIKNFLRLIL